MTGRFHVHGSVFQEAIKAQQQGAHLKGVRINNTIGRLTRT